MTVGRQVALWAFLATSATLGGCGQKSTVEAYFPLAEGHQWTYRVQTQTDGDSAAKLGERRIENRGTDVIAGVTVRNRRTEQGLDYWVGSDPTGVFRIAHRVPPDTEIRTDNPQRYVLRGPIAVGTRWETPTTLFLLATKHEVQSDAERTSAAVMMRYQIAAIDQEIVTPAGRFDRCITVEGEAEVRLWVETLRQLRYVPIRSTEWYCISVGLVRLERIETSPSRFMSGGKVLLELTDWQ
jgi:hypothetical protein